MFLIYLVGGNFWRYYYIKLIYKKQVFFITESNVSRFDSTINLEKIDKKN